MSATQSLQAQDECHERFRSMWDQVSSKDPHFRLRKKAWDRYENIGLPTRKTEVFRYVPIRKFFDRVYTAPSPVTQDAAAFTLPECKGALLVFVNGFFSEKLSRLENLPVVALPLSQAMNTYGAFINNQWDQFLAKETDPFAALNGALYNEGLFLYIPPKTILKQPIELLHIIDTNDQNMLMQPRVHVFVGQSADINLINTQKRVSGEGYAINGAVYIAVEENARVQYTSSVLDEPSTSWHFEAFRATLKRDSSLNTIQITDGSESTRHDYKVYLNGENALAKLNGLMMLDGARQAHANILVEHIAPHCTSHQLFKNALNHSARSSFEGKIYVHQEAQKTQAYQLNNNLILSDQAQADSKPNLEIFADDVKASHGSTVGQLDPEHLFYLKTRGFSDTDAKNLLIYGFCKEVIDMIDVASLHEEVTERAQRYLTQG